MKKVSPFDIEIEVGDRLRNKSRICGSEPLPRSNREKLRDAYSVGALFCTQDELKIPEYEALT